MAQRILVALLLLTIGFAVGTLRPQVSAHDANDRVVRELAAIRAEITQIRRALERR